MLEKISFYSQKSLISTFPLSKKFTKFSFLPNMFFPFVQSSCFYNNLSFFLSKKLTRETWNIIKELSFSDFYGCSMIYDNVGGIRDHLKLEPKQRHQYFNWNWYQILYHNKIHYIRNNWLGPIFFSAEDSHMKALLVLIHLI